MTKGFSPTSAAIFVLIVIIACIAMNNGAGL